MLATPSSVKCRDGPPSTAQRGRITHIALSYPSLHHLGAVLTHAVDILSTIRGGSSRQMLMAVVDLFAKVGVVCSVYCADLRVASRDVRDILKEANRFAATQRC